MNSLTHPESIELTNTTGSSSVQMRSHRRTPRRSQKKRRPSPTTNLLFCAYIFWIAISLIGALFLFAGFWLPYWIQGQYFESVDAVFGPFRRCNYSMRDETGKLTIVPQCARYESFENIPSLAWKIATVSSAISVCLAFLITFILFFSCCMSLSSNNAKSLLKFQLLSLLTILLACAAFPFGLDIPEVRDVCGDLNLPFDFGTCRPSLSIYLFIASTFSKILALLFGSISVRILQIQESRFRDDESYLT